MQINQSLCVACGICINRCTVDAIKKDGKSVYINLDECVECGVCKRWQICPKNAFEQQELKYPRIIRSIMSDVLTVCEEAQISGRGTEEMKTNEVTGRFQDGFIGLALELGRPGVATRIYDVERMAMAIAREDVTFEPCNPVTTMMADQKAGRFKEELLNERVLSAIIEFIIPIEKAEAVLNRIIDASKDIHSVFSLCIVSKVAADGTIPHVKIAEKMGLWISPNGKNNVGLGRPLYKG